MLKSRKSEPPGGWLFFQPQTGKSFGGSTFMQTVNAIIEHRQANSRFGLSVNPDAVAKELDDYTCARINHNPHYCVSENAASFSSPPLPQRQSGAGARSAVAAAKNGSFLKNATVGIKTYIDFFGDGRPVPQDVADKRAAVCAPCRLNEPGGLLERFTQAAAKEIMSIYGVLNDLNCKTALDEKLHVCSACQCPMKSKIWVNRDVIMKHMPKENFDKLVPECWMRIEP
jgi:hypothetical protein